MASRASPSIPGRWAPQLAPPAAPTRRYAISAVFRSLWRRESISRARRETGTGSRIAAGAVSSSSSSWPSATSSSSSTSTSFPSSLPEGCFLADASEARAIGGKVISLNSLVLIRTPRGAEEEGEDEEEDDVAPVEEGEEEEPEVDDDIKVAVAVLRASDALDLSAAARQLGWPGARLAPRSEVPRLLGYRFAPGGIPPLGHGGVVETLVCSRALLLLAAGEEEGGEGESDGRDSVAFVAGGGDPALRLVFRGPRALAAAMEAEGAKVVSGLGVERPPLVLPPPGAASTSSDGDGDENDDDDSASSSSSAPGAVYRSPPPLFVDDAEGVRALAEILLPPSNSNSTSSSEEFVSLPSATERNEDTQSSGGGGGGGSSSSSSSSSSAGSKKGAGSSNRQRWHLLGLDAEWVPESDRGASGRHPVETLQLATKEAAAVLDIAALARSREGSESIIDLLTRAATAGTGAGENGGGGGGGDSGVRVLFVGHSARQDLVRLARTLASASAARGEGGGGGGGAGREGEGEGGGGDSDCESPRPSLPTTLPPLPVHSVDLPAIARWAVSPPGAVVPAGRLPGGHGLANLVRIFLGDRGAGELSKEQQRSDWGRRPLSAEQLRYAAADAHACVAVAERILTELRPELASTRKRAAAHAGGLTELDGGFSRGGGGGRRNKNLPYLLAPLPPLAPGPARDARRAAREERRAEAAAMMLAAGEGRRGALDGSPLFSSSSRNLDRGAARNRRRGGGGGGGGDQGPLFPPPPGSGSAADADADVEGLLRDFLGLPLPGKGGRGLAVAAALGLLSPPPDDDGPSWRRRSGSGGRGRGGDGDDGDGERERRNQHLSVPRFDRGGVARLRNACVLFVNLDAGGGGGASRYPNEFIRGEAGETRLTWFPSPGQGESHPLVRRLLSPKIAGGEKHSVLLFCRLRSSARLKGGGNGPYYFLGRLCDARVDWGDGGGVSDLDEGSASFSSSAPRQYPAMFAWKLLDAEMAAARGGRGVEAIFEAGAPRRRSTTTAVG